MNEVVAAVAVNDVTSKIAEEFVVVVAAVEFIPKKSHFLIEAS